MFLSSFGKTNTLHTREVEEGGGGGYVTRPGTNNCQIYISLTLEKTEMLSHRSNAKVLSILLYTGA